MVAELPKVRGHWFWGSMDGMRQCPCRFVADIASKHGGMAQFRILHKKLIAVNDPDIYQQVMIRNHADYQRSFHFRRQQVLLGEGLITADGEPWKKKRKRATPAFRKDFLQRVVPLSSEITLKYFGNWLRQDKPLSLMLEMQKITMAVITRAVFSIEIESENIFSLCQAFVECNGIILKRNVSFFSPPLWWPTRQNAHLKHTGRILRGFILDLLEQRQQLIDAGSKGQDILDVLLAGRKFSELEQAEQEEVIDECKTLLVAGFETTSLSLFWALYEIDRHPQVREKWQAECRAVLKDGRLPTWDDLESLKYTRQIIMEILRLYPAVYTQPRECLHDNEVNGIKVRKGDVVLLSVYGIQRDPERWENPDAFIPERFAQDRHWPEASYMPFGKGKHACLGNNFSIYEMLVVLSLMGSRLEFERLGSESVGIKPMVVLRPDKEVLLRARQIND